MKYKSQQQLQKNQAVRKKHKKSKHPNKTTPVHKTLTLIAQPISEGWDEAAHPRSFTRAFTDRIHKEVASGAISYF